MLKTHPHKETKKRQFIIEKNRWFRQYAENDSEKPYWTIAKQIPSACDNKPIETATIPIWGFLRPGENYSSSTRLGCLISPRDEIVNRNDLPSDKDRLLIRRENTEKMYIKYFLAFPFACTYICHPSVCDLLSRFYVCITSVCLSACLFLNPSIYLKNLKPIHIRISTQ